MVFFSSSSSTTTLTGAIAGATSKSTLLPSTVHYIGGLLPPPPSYLVTAAESSHSLKHFCKCRRWESYRQSYRTEKLDVNFEDNGDGYEEEESEDSVEQPGEVFEDFVDSIWIFKVFRSYGWMLPFIILSTLLATGPKAFLTALALPLGQSTFSFAIQKMREGKRSTPRQKVKSKERSSYAQSSARAEKQNRGWSQCKINIKKEKQSKGDKNHVSGDPNEKDTPSFGGWDQLDNHTEVDADFPRDIDQTPGRSNKQPSEVGGPSGKKRKSDTPSLLKLLVADFPFMGSLTKMLKR